jgi:hypothetical protein
MRGLEQEVVDQSWIGSGEWMESVRKRRDDMKIGHRQEVLCPVLDPLRPGDGLALGTVAVTAGIVDVLLDSAAVTAKDVPTKDGRSAELDGAHDSVLLPGNVVIVSVGVTELAEDIRDVELRSLHREPQTSSMSRGLVTLRLSGTILR